MLIILIENITWIFAILAAFYLGLFLGNEKGYTLTQTLYAPTKWGYEKLKVFIPWAWGKIVLATTWTFNKIKGLFNRNKTK